MQLDTNMTRQIITFAALGCLSGSLLFLFLKATHHGLYFVLFGESGFWTNFSAVWQRSTQYPTIIEYIVVFFSGLSGVVGYFANRLPRRLVVLYLILVPAVLLCQRAKDILSLAISDPSFSEDLLKYNIIASSFTVISFAVATLGVVYVAAYISRRISR